MTTLQSPIDFPCAYPLKRLGPYESLLFFDIETTGFSAETSQVYLIGCIFYNASTARWNLIQWFADTPESEIDLLNTFFRFSSGYQTAIHFNGDSFDIPFLLKRCLKHGLPWISIQPDSLDIYRKIRPYQSLLGLSSMKQKSIEEFLNINRKDTASGGQLISVYETYLLTKSQPLYKLLILHNRDDLNGLFQILPVLNYPDMFEQQLFLASQTVSRPSPEEPPFLDLVYESPCTLPVPFQIPGTFLHSQILGSGSSLFCRILLFQGELKYFYPNYKDYYYLPCEDTAIHKSVGTYVSGNARKKATAKTCYTKKSGLFLPQKTPLSQPVFREEYNSSISYLLYDKSLLLDAKLGNAFLRQLLFGY
ncbi:MAG: ribonuclease H-like domain-containing protein [Lachnospiraceae bacterium]|jgi:uncharacterized protein YprB with RNaseH-like and TPR domain|nr:ribonuclease H-like domain-containing protein [Lachnospiraceae bacterium]